MLAYKTEYHGEDITEDSDLEACEKETGLCFSNASDDITINTHQVPLIKALLRCEFFTPTEIELKGKCKVVIGLSGVLPVSCLRIMRPRKDTRLKTIISRSTQAKRPIVRPVSKMYKGCSDPHMAKCVQSKR